MFPARVRKIIQQFKNDPALGTTPRYMLELFLSQYLGDTNARLSVIEEVLNVVNTNTAKAFTSQIPANSVVVYAQMNYDTAVGLATAVKVGLGISGGVSNFLLSGTAVTKNTKTNGAPTLANGLVATATTPQIACVDTSGAAAGTFNASASIRARLVYWTFESLPDAP